MAAEMLDAIGVPEYFVTVVGRVEAAGGGCVRVYNCVERGGVMIPQCTIVIPAINLLTAGRFVSDAARLVFTNEALAIPH